MFTVWEKDSLSVTSQRQQRHGLDSVFWEGGAARMLDAENVKLTMKERRKGKYYLHFTRLVFNVKNKYARVQII